MSGTGPATPPEAGAGRKRHYGEKTTLKLAQQFRPDDATKARSMSDMLVQPASWQCGSMIGRSWRSSRGAFHLACDVALAVDRAKGSKSTMEEMHQRCVAEGWSVDCLNREVQNDKGVKRMSGHKPEPLRPHTAGIAATDLIIAARRWTTYHEKWLTGRKSALNRARRADYDSTLRDVEEAIRGLEEVQGAVKDELAELRHAGEEDQVCA